MSDSRPEPGDFESRRRAVRDDHHTTIGQLRELVDRFVAERDWHRFHRPKNLSMALAVEAAELMEHFQWADDDACRGDSTAESRAAVAEELADVICYALAMANALGIDVSRAVADKMAANARKYPPGNPSPTAGESRAGSSAEAAGSNRAADADSAWPDRSSSPE